MSRIDPTSGGLRLVATGDSLISQRISIFKEKEFLKVRDIVRDADASFNNFETIIPGDRGAPRYKVDPTAWMNSRRFVLDELLWMGFNMFSLANNHSMDYGEGGLVETKRVFEEAGVANAGTGRTLSEARQPVYINTERGRVAFVVVNTMGDDIPASDPRGKVPGRPGLNPLRFKQKILLDRPEFERLREINRKLGLPEPKGGRLIFLGNIVELSNRNDIQTEPYEPDLDGNLKSVEEARRYADYVFVSIHNHEKLRPGSMYFDDTIEHIAGFAEVFCRRAIDAGADAILGHGTHCLNGVEIYKGHPIFYGLGNFISQSYASNPKPYDWYEARGLHREAYPDESKGNLYPALEGEAEVRRLRRLSTGAVAKVEFKDSVAEKITLYPIETNRQHKQGGRPFLATGASAEEIIGRLARLSKDYGTKIDFENEVGEIQL
jgi:poly-gamma-glutamate capsule biosynthesis protein CapA/YwtB (metallophosphatase superfamily)